jgi:hypothetical protein
MHSTLTFNTMFSKVKPNLLSFFYFKNKVGNIIHAMNSPTKGSISISFCTIDLTRNLLQWMYFWVSKKTWENIGMLLKKLSSKPTCHIPTLWTKKTNPIIKIISRWWRGGIGIRKGFGWTSMSLWFTRLSKFLAKFYPQKK